MFKKESFRKNIKITMTINDKMIILAIKSCNYIKMTLTKKLKNISIKWLTSGKMEKYEYLTCKEILPSDQSRITERVKFSCFPLGKTLEKQKKSDWRPRIKTNKDNWK